MLIFLFFFLRGGSMASKRSVPQRGNQSFVANVTQREMDETIGIKDGEGTGM
jgi:hypothetical protein